MTGFKINKVIIALFSQILICLCVYLFIPAAVELFGAYGDPFGGVAQFAETLALDVVVAIVISFVVLLKYTPKIIYVLTFVPVYLFFALIMLLGNIKTDYPVIIGFGDFVIDIVFAAVLIPEFIVFAVTKFRIRNRK
ncbi:hypothetical protein FACS189499_07190 [Clostridia bacterium]|nr:hypothetical protein FACS189499_07190 [Clostridia bacterium]